MAEDQKAHIRPRRGTASSWESANPTLLDGEMGVETDTGAMKRGDGATAWNDLDYWIGEIVTVDPEITEQDRTSPILTWDGDKWSAQAGNPGYWTGPGPQELQAGNWLTQGFFGEVPASEFIDGPTLASEIGLDQESDGGTAFNDDEPWLKFWSFGEVLFVAKKPFRHSVDWDAIDNVGAVDGTAEVEIDISKSLSGYTEGVDVLYKVRLLTGGNGDRTIGDHSDDRGKSNVQLGGGSEWNQLIYRIHSDVPTDTTSNSGGRQIGDDWASYSDSDLGIGSGDGRGTWCQEVIGNDTGRRVRRGPSGVAHFLGTTSSATRSGVGWRPCLVLANR